MGFWLRGESAVGFSSGLAIDRFALGHGTWALVQIGASLFIKLLFCYRSYRLIFPNSLHWCDDEIFPRRVVMSLVHILLLNASLFSYATLLHLRDSICDLVLQQCLCCDVLVFTCARLGHIPYIRGLYQYTLGLSATRGRLPQSACIAYAFRFKDLICHIELRYMFCICFAQTV